MTRMRSRPARVAMVCLIQVALLVAAVFGQLSARVAGEEYLVRVAPLDPIDPFRGAYVALDYPDLDLTGSAARTAAAGTASTSPWSATVTSGSAAPPVTWRPDGPALRCVDKGWRLSLRDRELLPAPEPRRGRWRTPSGPGRRWPGCVSTRPGMPPSSTCWWRPHARPAPAAPD